ncbi:MAG: AAA family ATPase [Defluviitaleaceae bacterium]|nr:AAA family ATPase [Defluviitaleaceae bacterium]
MARGIIISGASGVGKTTLGTEVAKRLGWEHLDLDEYFWKKDTTLPFTEFYSKDEMVIELKEKIAKQPHFVMSGNYQSLCREYFKEMFVLAVFLTVPQEERMERVRNREINRYGDRILQGGDMHKNHIEFYEWAKAYDGGENPNYCLEKDRNWALELSQYCLVLHLDGTKPVNENTETIVKQLNLLQSPDCVKHAAGTRRV